MSKSPHNKFSLLSTYINIADWGKFGQNKEWGCYLNESYSIQRTILRS